MNITTDAVQWRTADRTALLEFMWNAPDMFAQRKSKQFFNRSNFQTPAVEKKRILNRCRTSAPAVPQWNSLCFVMQTFLDCRTAGAVSRRISKWTGILKFSYLKRQSLDWVRWSYEIERIICCVFYIEPIEQNRIKSNSGLKGWNEPYRVSSIEGYFDREFILSKSKVSLIEAKVSIEE